jgi:YD repeat-containing protein
MEASRDRWISFEYDASDRIVHAYSSDKHFVDYEYDGRGRLTRVSSDQGLVRRYGYTDQDQMASIDDPDILITNAYDQDGHCIGQLNRFPGKAETLSFRFDYRLQDDRVVETTSTESDGTWSRYGFNEQRQTTSEAWGGEGLIPTTIAYERDAETGAETALTVTCPDRRGQPLSHRSLVRPGTAEWIKRDLLETHCSSIARQ